MDNQNLPDSKNNNQQLQENTPVAKPLSRYSRLKSVFVDLSKQKKVLIVFVLMLLISAIAVSFAIFTSLSDINSSNNDIKDSEQINRNIDLANSSIDGENDDNSSDPTSQTGDASNNDSGGGSGSTNPTEPPGSGSGGSNGNLFGYTGCSNTHQTIQGYHALSNSKSYFWKAVNYSGSSVEVWANPNDPIWNSYDQKVAVHGQPGIVWVQLCENETRPITYETVKQALANLKTHSPSAVFYISPLNSYNPATLCDRLGTDGISDLIEFANQASNEGLGLRGPDIGPLTTQTTQGDKCHPNYDGQDLLGQQIADYFDPLW